MYRSSFVKDLPKVDIGTISKNLPRSWLIVPCDAADEPEGNQQAGQDDDRAHLKRSARHSQLTQPDRRGQDCADPHDPDAAQAVLPVPRPGDALTEKSLQSPRRRFRLHVIWRSIAHVTSSMWSLLLVRGEAAQAIPVRRPGASG